MASPSPSSHPEQGMGKPPGPPYPPMGALLGGVPNVSDDIPISSVFIAIFIVGAICHMTLFRRNLSRGHKFIPSALTFGFCMARIVGLVMRIVWATRSTNARIAIAAQILVAAGVLLLYILNLLYAQRMLRASHPSPGWARWLHYSFIGLYTLIGLTFVMVMTTLIQSFYTLNPNTHRIDRNIQRYAASFNLTISFLPLPIIAWATLVPRKQPIDKFGEGSWRAKAMIVSTATALICLGAGFRAGVGYSTPRPISHPAWYHHKACFYVFYFTIEAAVVFLYFFGRVDKRFHVPDGSSKVRSYGGTEKGSDHSRADTETASSRPSSDKSPQ